MKTTGLVVFGLTCALLYGSSGQQGNQRKQINDPAEYNAYVSALQQQNPTQKAQLLETFVRAYPNSVMKEDALEILMAAYQQAGQGQMALETANRILQVNASDVRALALLTYNYRAAASNGGPQMQDNLARAKQYGQQGLQALQNTPKPEGMSDADFANMRNLMGAIFSGAVGFAALQAKDYSTAQTNLREAVSKEGQPGINDLYVLATAYLEDRPLKPEGFWFLIKAAQLAQPGAQQKILDYGRKKYIRFHGSEVGWTDLVNDARASASVMPPFGFTVAAAPPPPPLPVQAAEIVKYKAPQEMSFAEWQLVLSSGNAQAAQTVWNAIKGKTVRLAAIVVSANANQLELAGSDDDVQANRADITLKMSTPMQSQMIPAVGKLVEFHGTITSYNTSPFTLIFTRGTSGSSQLAATSAGQSGSSIVDSGGTTYGSDSPGIGSTLAPPSCNEVNSSVRAESRVPPSGPGNCGGEVDAWLTNISGQIIDCTIIFHRNGIWDTSSGLTVTLRPGEKLGGFLSPGGIWTCGADSGTVRYACFPHTQEQANECTARVQWPGAPPPSPSMVQHQPQSLQRAPQTNCNHEGCTTH